VFKISSFEVEKGTKKSGVLKVVERSLGPIDVPITIVNGIESGPILCVLAGEHGCEYAGIETCIRLSKDINPKELRGTLIVLPIINVPGFQARTPYICPIDGVNIGRAWPGNLIPYSSISNFITYNIFHDVILKSNYVVDLHGGDLVESISDPCIYLLRTGKKEIDEVSESLANVFGVEYIVETFPPKTGEPPGTLQHEAAKRGIPAILAEAGHEGKVEEKDVTLLYNGVLNVMKHLEMVRGKPGSTIKPKMIRMAKVTTEKGGLFYSNFEVGSIISQGDVLGEIRDIHGKTIHRIIAPTKGKIWAKVNTLPWDPALGHFLFLLLSENFVT